MYHFPDRGRNVPVQDWMSFWNPFRLMDLAQPFYKNMSACDRILRPGRADEAPSFQPGDKVRVRSAAEILSTLDMTGRLNGAPFLNVMMPLIGAAGTVQTVMPSAMVVLEFGAGGYWAWKTDWLALDGPAPQLAQRAEEAARRRLAALAADYPEA
ncbi:MULTISPECIES: hypothetical protein [Asticcacaulis]|uniref:hypothetical protein n=1 Tax=Asticcacaulis TaxID=76890 RepID=UPI001AE7FEB0|nr:MULTISPECIES: hypothetical protein [Asticcacaulis]MBP2159804.1 hypothetical protein [Asticcacaulis solisilvae]MDR6800849.1 hypothetical protein [Asticcacaulis sp. BE141]